MDVYGAPCMSCIQGIHSIPAAIHCGASVHTGSMTLQEHQVGERPNLPQNIFLFEIFPREMSHAGITCKTSNAPLFFLTATFIFLTIRNQFGGENTETQINLAVVSNFTAIEILLIRRLTNYQIIVLLVNSTKSNTHSLSFTSPGVTLLGIVLL